MKVEVESEADGRFIAEVTTIPGAMVYGATAQEAISKVEALVLRILADRIESGEHIK
jgi:predicted RNase H-like HicB family nuclease